MTRYQRAVHGAEAGAIAAVTLEVAFFVFDSIRLVPLATPLVLSGASMGPGGAALDLSSLTGVIGGVWGFYQILTLTLVHLATFAAVGVCAALLFDWSRPGNLGRLGVVALLSTAGFYGTVAISSSLVALDSVGTLPIIGINLLAAGVLAGGLRLVSMPVPDAGEQAA